MPHIVTGLTEAPSPVARSSLNPVTPSAPTITKHLQKHERDDSGIDADIHKVHLTQHPESVRFITFFSMSKTGRYLFRSSCVITLQAHWKV